MKRIILLVGVRGAGKSTLLNNLKQQSQVYILQPVTDREPRSKQDKEYEFTKADKYPHGNALAWSIELNGHRYGVKKRVIEAIPEGKIGVAVFHPGSIEKLEQFRKTSNHEVITVGLDTLESFAQHENRVGNDSTRLMRESDFNNELSIVRNSDIVFKGDANKVLEATSALVEVLNSRGGLIGSNWLTPLIAAGALLGNADLNCIEPASYDLRMGNEVWCQGKRRQLSEADPFFQIPPYSYAIVKASETARIPCILAGRFDLKVSLFFEGVLLSNGPQVDPGYNGALFCTLFNGRDIDTRLKMGDHFATIEFCSIAQRVDGYSGQHQDKDSLNKFLTGKTATEPGGDIVGRVKRLEEISFMRWFLTIALPILGFLGVPLTVFFGTVSSMQTQMEKKVEELESSTKANLNAILIDLPDKAGKARQSLSDTVNKIEQLNYEIDELKKQLERQEKVPNHPEDVEAAPVEEVQDIGSGD